jgi:hypothetical protein
MERQATSKKRLDIKWDHPVPGGEEVLGFSAALDEIRGKDPRPLIILRDCDSCKGRDDALLSDTLSNEKVLLLTHWFHCVKLDRRVVEEGHPFHSLFEGKNPPHILFSSWEGAKVIPLPGKQSQKKVWTSLTSIMKIDYKKDPNKAIKNWRKILNSFDSLDSQLKEFRGQLEKMELKYGPKSDKAKKLAAKIEKLDKAKKKALADEKANMNLILRHAPKVKTEADFDSEAAAEVSSKKGSSLLDRLRKKSEKKEPGVPRGDQ